MKLSRKKWFPQKQMIRKDHKKDPIFQSINIHNVGSMQMKEMSKL